MKNYLHQLYFLLGEDRRKLPGLGLLFLLVSLFELVGIGLLGPYVALLVSPDAWMTSLSPWARSILGANDYKSLVYWFGLMLLSIFLLKSVMMTWANYLIVRFSQDQQRRLRANLLQAFQATSWPAFLSRTNGSRSNAIIIGASHFSQLTYELLRFLSDATVVVLLFVLLAWTNVKALLLLVSLLLVPLWLYDILVKRRLKRLGETSERTIIRIIDLVNEAMNGFKEVRLLGRERFFSDQVRQASIEHADSQAGIALTQFVSRQLLELILVAFVVLLTLGLAGSAQSPAAMLPTLGVLCGAAVRLLPIAKNSSDTFSHLRRYRTVIQILYEDIQTWEKMTAGSNVLALQPKDIGRFQSLELAAVDFSYPGATKPVLSKVGFSLRAGEAVGLVGQSGAGKTTFLDLLLGLLEPGAGTILINGNNADALPAWWQQKVTYMPQDALIINDTLANNITMASSDEVVDRTRLDHAIAMARLADLVTDWPRGINTLLGPGGVRLSGGQKQRVALARALYHRREVLVLDEITANLDQKTEQEIFEGIASLKGSLAIVVVSHDVALLTFCDRIYALDESRLVDTPHERLEPA